jgi:hypothetical protein
MGRTFQYLNREWSVEITGLWHKVAIGRWAVQFKPVDDPSAEPVYGSIWRPDLAQLSDDDFRKSLVRKHLKIQTKRLLVRKIPSTSKRRRCFTTLYL